MQCAYVHRSEIVSRSSLTGICISHLLPWAISAFEATILRLNRNTYIITFRLSRRPRKMYCGHARLCVCLSAAACLHYCTDPDVTWRTGIGDAPYLCTIGRICNRCTGCVAMATLWKCVVQPSGNPPGPPHAARMPHRHTTHAGED